MAVSRPWKSRSGANGRDQLERRDALLFIGASAIGSFGLGVAAFYLNFLYRALGLGDAAIGALAGALALGGVVGAAPAWFLARGVSRRAAVFVGGGLTATGLIGILAFEALPPLLASAALLGAGGIIVSSSGSALIADATAAPDRAAMFGRQIAFGTAMAFIASFAAGALAAPVGGALGAAENDARVVRVLIGAGGLIAAVSAVPALFVRAVRVPRGGHERGGRRRLLGRFLGIEVLFGFGAGSFLPFVNLFFADRFALDLRSIGLALGVLAVGGSLGALVHARVAARLGLLPSVVLFQLASLPFAIAAAIAGAPWLAVGALGIRALLMYGASSSYGAFTHSSFAPSERAGAHAVLALAWGAGSAVGATTSGAIRGALGPDGYTVNLATLAGAYLAAALLTWALFRSHEPRGDALAGPH